MKLVFEKFSPSELKKVMQSLATLDAIVSPDWTYRYYMFDAHWGGNMIGSINNGCGDDVFVFFNHAGCFLKGYSHEYLAAAIEHEEFYRTVPQVFEGAAKEPAFSPENVAFTSWRLSEDESWEFRVAKERIEGEAFFLVDELDGKAETYVAFAKDYYEVDLDLVIVRDIFQHKLVTQKMARGLNRDVEFAALIEDLDKIGYDYKAALGRVCLEDEVRD